MDNLRIKIKNHEQKYGSFFLELLNLIKDLNPYHLTLEQDEIYVDLCESLLSQIHRELAYHNYIMMISEQDYGYLIWNCVNKSIFLKDLQRYEMSIDKITNLCHHIHSSLTSYLNHLRSQARITVLNNNLYLSSDLNLLKAHRINVSQLHHSFNKTRGSISHSRQSYNLNHNLPIAKLELNYAKVPILSHNGIKFQKNLLDLDTKSMV